VKNYDLIMEISLKEFMASQPNNPNVTESDKYYLLLANRLCKIWDNARILLNVGDDTRKRVVLAVTGYYQDIIADAGVWRSFSTMCQQLYGRPVPIYDRPEDYIDSELNEIDVRFIMWYVLECYCAENGTISPYDEDLLGLSHKFFNVLDAVYDDAPTPVEYNMIMDVELDDSEQTKQIYDLSYWLFWNCYFLRPAAMPTLQRAAVEAHKIIHEHPERSDAEPLLLELNERIMSENPTGPLSLSLGEWIEMIVNNKMPQFAEEEFKGEPHKFYAALTHATGGIPIAFCDSYEALEDFVSNALGWGTNKEGHLPQMKKFSNFVLYADPKKGLLIAHDVAQFIKHPDNPAYDAEKAKTAGHSMLTRQGVCPIDLVKYVFENGYAPDVRMPFESDDTGKSSILNDHWDFFARLYLQSFYQPD
jgi:hypothetical protein